MQRFEVSGMTCGHCVRAVTEAVHGVDAAAQVEVDLAASRVTVRDGTAPPEQIAQAIEAEGYPARLLAA
ncbi:MAG: heavy-metal-associated domain-containing protein [Janthinobacterium lividum]